MVSKKPGKQRLKGSESPIHLKRKRIRARLVTDDPELQSIRSVTVRVGDEVEVLLESALQVVDYLSSPADDPSDLFCP